ncbi:glycosyltransferase [Acetobacterium bakii]|uniref:Glycosyltransferase 2-like domain-containing protein n=1 Tax=Acetobacterium bakii TaxID=52689 RepID=A0A0L6U1Y1_9FIRM|nr:glycosyltransferase [Acetobacterium bakii]KNZ42524.1 hypothetical protein AKG39_06280 [Acetobacterium bakii]
MKYAAAIVFYNPDEDAIKRISRYSNNFDEILVIDNSEKEKINIANELMHYENCLYHKMNGNEGMAKALNYAFYRAIEREYEIILTMDQDSLYTDENIKTMKDFINGNFDENVGIYSPNYSKLYFDEKLNAFIVGKPVIKKSDIKRVDFCMTSGSFVNVKALKKVLPIDDYFIGYVDNYLCARLTEMDFKLLRVGSSCFNQQVGGKVKNTIFNRIFNILHHAEIRYYYMFRNNLFLQERFKKNFLLKTRSKIDLIRIMVNIIIGEENKWKKIKACETGYKDFKRKIMGKVPDESITW